MERPGPEGDTVKTRHFSRSARVCRLLKRKTRSPPVLISDCKCMGLHYTPLSLQNDGCISRNYSHNQTLQDLVSICTVWVLPPAKPWVGSCKPPSLSWLSPSLLKKAVPGDMRGKNHKCLITVLSVTGLYSFSLFSLKQLPLTPSRETLGSCCIHAAEQEEESEAAYLTLRVADRTFYCKCLCINTQKPVLVGFFWIS